MQSVLAAEPAILVHFQSVRVVLLVFHRVVVALFALCAGESDFDSHFRHLPIRMASLAETARFSRTKIKPPARYYQLYHSLSISSRVFLKIILDFCSKKSVILHSAF